MTDLDSKIREALKESGVDPPDLESEETLRAQIAETFRGKLRGLTILAWVEQLIFFLLTIFVAVRFFQVESTRDLILYATLFLACLWATVAIKMWFWMLLNKNAITREIKRLELQVATLARQK